MKDLIKLLVGLYIAKHWVMDNELAGKIYIKIKETLKSFLN